MLADLIATRTLLRDGATTAPAELERCIEAAQAPRNAHSFVRTLFDSARTEAAQPDLARLPLAGLAVSVKDLFDIQGQPTPAGSTVLADAPRAPQDSPAVARLAHSASAPATPMLPRCWVDVANASSPSCVKFARTMTLLDIVTVHGAPVSPTGGSDTIPQPVHDVNTAHGGALGLSVTTVPSS